jgi:putative transposase
MIQAEVALTRTRSGWAAGRTLQALGIPRATYYRHLPPATVPTPPTPAVAPSALTKVLPAEREAVVAFARKHPELRHRALAWTMIDLEVACLSPMTVYRLLQEEGLIAPCPVVATKRGHRPEPPTRATELWQTDLRYVKLAGQTYYLLIFLDVYSRYIVYHELLHWMDGATVALAAQQALEQLSPEARKQVRIQSDNGSPYISADFARVLKEHGVGHHRIWPHTPEQNGHVERVMRTLGEALHEAELATFDQAVQAIAEIITWYNQQRLHSALGYLTPATVHAGEGATIQAARRAKLAQARLHRREMNLTLRQLSLPLSPSAQPDHPADTANSLLSHFG